MDLCYCNEKKTFNLLSLYFNTMLFNAVNIRGLFDVIEIWKNSIVIYEY